MGYAEAGDSLTGYHGKAKYFLSVSTAVLCLLTLATPALGDTAKKSDSEKACRKAISGRNGPHVQILHSESGRAKLRRLDEAVWRRALRQRGPKGQAMAVQLVDGEPTVYGTRVAVERARENIDELRPYYQAIKDAIEGKKFKYKIDGVPVEIEIAVGVTGSSTISEYYSDLDFELWLVVKHEKFSMSDFSDPQSITIKAVHRAFTDLTNNMIASGMIFSEVKAGEYDQPLPGSRRTKSRGIKWTAEEVSVGWKQEESDLADQTSGSRTISFSEALADNSRLKIDFIQKVPMHPSVAKATGLKHRYAETSLLIELAGQRGNNTPVLRIANENRFPEIGATGGHIALAGRNSHTAVRATSLFFDLDDLELARRISISSPTLPLNYLNAAFVNSAQTYWGEQSYFKVLKLLFMRLHFWQDLEYFNNSDGQRELSPLSYDEVFSKFEEVLLREQNLQIYQLADYAKQLMRLKELEALTEAEETRFLRAMTQFIKQVDPDTKIDGRLQSGESAYNHLQRIINTRILAWLAANPRIQQYVNYSFHRPYAETYKALDSDPVFLSFELPQTTRDELTKRLDEWRDRYPNIDFSLAEDLHMTAAYAGSVSSDLVAKIRAIGEKYSALIAEENFRLGGGRFEIIGSNNAQLALVFDEEDVSDTVRGLIRAMKRELEEIGVEPDSDHFDGFVPHISLAYVRDVTFDPNSHLQLAQFLTEQQASGALEEMELSGLLEFLRVQPRPTEVPHQRRYSSEVDPDISPGDIHDIR